MMHYTDSQVGFNRCLCGLFSDVAKPTRPQSINHAHYIDIYSCVRLQYSLVNENDVVENIQQEKRTGRSSVFIYSTVSLPRIQTVCSLGSASLCDLRTEDVSTQGSRQQVREPVKKKKKSLPPPTSKFGANKNIYSKSEIPTLSCRVIQPASERDNLYNRHIQTLPINTKTNASQSGCRFTSGTSGLGNIYRLPHVLSAISVPEMSTVECTYLKKNTGRQIKQGKVDMQSWNQQIHINIFLSVNIRKEFLLVLANHVANLSDIK